MKTPRILRVLTALAMVLALAACGSSGDDGAAASDAGGSASVKIDDLAYSPTDLEVPAGTTVTWTNDDQAPHTVTFDGEAIDSSDQMETGDTFSATFDTPGAYPYICAIHPEMTAEVSVS